MNFRMEDRMTFGLGLDIKVSPYIDIYYSDQEIGPAEERAGGWLARIVDIPLNAPTVTFWRGAIVRLAYGSGKDRDLPRIEEVVNTPYQFRTEIPFYYDLEAKRLCE